MKKLTKLAAVAFVAIVGAGLPPGMSDLRDLFRTGVNPDTGCPSLWCSNNAQCEVWYGAGSICIKLPGKFCGRCT